jgi:hypothetical protein
MSRRLCVVWLDTTLDQATRRAGPLAGVLSDEPGGGVLLRARADDLDRIARLLVLLECGFAVREPPELRDAVARLGALLSASALRDA